MLCLNWFCKWFSSFRGVSSAFRHRLMKNNRILQHFSWTLLMKMKNELRTWFRLYFALLWLTFRVFLTMKWSSVTLFFFSHFWLISPFQRTFWNNFLKSALLFENRSFYAALLSCFFNCRFSRTLVTRRECDIRVSIVVFFWLCQCIFKIIQILLVREI